MILWIILFVLVLLISYILASRSMRDFTFVLASADYSLFLIRNVRGLSEHLLKLIHQDLQKTSLAVSFERLFKGSESALVIVGPSKILTKYTHSLNLLELEDYTNVDKDIVAGWEVGIKNNPQIDDTPKSVPILDESEHFWWQVTLWKGGTHIRCLVVSADDAKRKNLTHTLPYFPSSRLTKLPKAFSNEQLFEAYKKRSFSKDKKGIQDTNEILKLLWI